MQSIPQWSTCHPDRFLTQAKPNKMNYHLIFTSNIIVIMPFLKLWFKWSKTHLHHRFIDKWKYITFIDIFHFHYIHYRMDFIGHWSYVFLPLSHRCIYGHKGSTYYSSAAWRRQRKSIFNHGATHQLVYEYVQYRWGGGWGWGWRPIMKALWNFTLSYNDYVIIMLIMIIIMIMMIILIMKMTVITIMVIMI